MYIPNRYQELDPATIEQFIQANDFATLISYDGQRPVATHLLLELQHGEGDTRTLNGHLARANPQWQTFAPDQEVLAIFAGPHTYISPRWYDHVNVPTWNYLAVHVYGLPRLITDDAELYAMFQRLVAKHEANSGYGMDTLSADFVTRQFKGLVGFELQVTRIEASFKLSQNRNARDYANIITELHQRPDENSHGVAEAMEKKQAQLYGAG